MSKTAPKSPPPDHLQRQQALDPACSILVQAPAGSGKTTLLTERFLVLLAEVNEPGQVVAITFTIAAAAEMRNRILDVLRDPDPTPLARRVLDHSNALGWKLLDLPAQLRISTIDSFCRDLALQQPLLSGFGGGLDIAEQPNDLYRRAARNTLEQIGSPDNPALSDAVEALLDWRDNNWQELEDLLVEMLSKRDRWMHDFVLSRDPDWDELRERLERPFANAVRNGLAEVSRLLDQAPGAREEALLLARFACSQPNGDQHSALAEMVEFPNAPFLTPDKQEEAHQALLCLANLVLTLGNTFRKSIDKNLGFPVDRKPEKARILKLIADLDAVPGLDATLADVRNLPPARYTEEDWKIVRACFALLRHAAGQLKIVFAEAAAVDFIEVAQIAEGVLHADDGFPSEAAMAVADGILHLLVDEFQDTSRRQHQLLAGLIAAWPDHASRTLFAVGDPMQSIYFFRDADAELFARVKEIGLEIPNGDPLTLDFVSLFANFRSAHSLVERLSSVFEQVFAIDDGSGVSFSPAEPARDDLDSSRRNFQLHLNFSPQTVYKKQVNSQQPSGVGGLQAEQIAEIVELIQSHQQAVGDARRAGKKYRVAVLARTRSSLAPIAQALHEAAIPFRALDLEKLQDRPEVLDALALGRALLNTHDRVAWLGVLRAPWCGLALDDLHALTSNDDSALLSRPVPELLAERLELLSEDGQIAGTRVLSALVSVPTLRASLPTASLGTWLQQIWLRLGGADCCDATARANLDLLWTCLDGLPAGEQDLLGPALDAALVNLTALPDPAASSDCGVQLMTIHKSKGLEFEIVIVPDLQARTRATSRKLLSWLERGLTPETDAEEVAEITEFLIAPLQTKGEQSKGSKAWVDRVYRERESQETRRILYVAATRAREELHLFARPAYKVEASGELSLVEPSGSLLCTAWPALEEEVRARFDEWKLSRQVETGQVEAEVEDEIESLAASGESQLIVTASLEGPAATPTLLRRLPANYRNAQLEGFTAPGAPSFPRSFAERVGDHDPGPGTPNGESARVPQVRGPHGQAFVGGAEVSHLRPGNAQLYTRHEGGLVSRVLGTAVHALLEELARLRATCDWQAARAALGQFEARIAAEVRSTGMAATQAAQIAANALQIALNASHDPTGEWILSPHVEAASEVRWTGVVGGALSNVRVDRVFRAGSAPLSEGNESWWIVDYKTAQGDGDVERLRPLFAGQPEAYARVLRNLHGDDSVIRAGLYYPRMLVLDWWEL
jgi:ATP-dependent helicase/nuclease subunit A